MTKTLLAAAGVALVVSALMVWVTGGTVKVAEQPTKLGALAGPDIPFPYLAWGGVQEYHGAQSFTATSSVLCAIQAPAATSTLLGYTADIQTIGGLLTTDAVFIATSTTNSASSTNYFAFRTLQAQGTLVMNPSVASTSAYAGQIITAKAFGQSDNVIQPNVYVTLRVGTTSAGTFASYPTGTCKARFQQIP